MMPFPAGAQQQVCDQLAAILSAARDHATSRGVLLLTHDPDAALVALRDVAEERGVPLAVMSMAGRQVLRPGRHAFDIVGGASPDPVDVLRSASDMTDATMVVFRDMLQFLSDRGGDPRGRAQALQMLSGDNRQAHVYVFCEPPASEGHAPSFAQARLTRIMMGLPRGEELVRLTKEELAATAARRSRTLEGPVLAAWAARLAAELPGLSHSTARLALQDAIGSEFDLEQACQELAERKSRLLESQLAMQVLRAPAEAPVAMDNYYRWIRTYRESMCRPGTDRVKGAVLIGPPGTGKTRLGAYTAHLLGVPAVWFRFGALLGRYVGDSEASAERAFAVLDALGTGPDSKHERGVVVVLDEIEKTITRGDNDGGVSMRVTARMLTWMSESTAPNMVLATANDLESMGDLADIITRRGRLDRVFFVDVPNREGRRQLFERLLRGAEAGGGVDLCELAGASMCFSGADIEALVRDAVAEARFEGIPVAHAHLARQIERSRVRVQAQYERFNRLREWARLNAEPAGSAERD